MPAGRYYIMVVIMVELGGLSLLDLRGQGSPGHLVVGWARGHCCSQKSVEWEKYGREQRSSWLAKGRAAPTGIKTTSYLLSRISPPSTDSLFQAPVTQFPSLPG